MHYYRIKESIYHYILYSLLLFLALVCALPIIYIIANSMMSAPEIHRYYGSIKNGGFVFHLIPEEISIAGYYAALLAQPEFLMKLWISCFVSLTIVFGQVFMSCLAGYSFAKFSFPFKYQVFYIYIVFMMLPFIVTLVPNEIIIRKLGLNNNLAALILPAVFTPLGVFIMRQTISAIPNEVLDAGQVDGSGHIKVLFRLVLPQCKAGIVSTAILSFIDSWNMVEQPLVLIKDYRMHPLSIFLSYIRFQRIDMFFACSVITIIPSALLFFFFEEELMLGIEYTGLQ